jgi:hypothetical protein
MDPKRGHTLHPDRRSPPSRSPRYTEAHQRGPFGLMRFDYFRAPILGHGLNPVAALAMRSDPKGLHDGSMAHTVLFRKGNIMPGFAMTSLPHKRIEEALWRREGYRTHWAPMSRNRCSSAPFATRPMLRGT